MLIYALVGFNKGAVTGIEFFFDIEDINVLANIEVWTAAAGYIFLYISFKKKKNFCLFIYLFSSSFLQTFVVLRRFVILFRNFNARK